MLGYLGPEGTFSHLAAQEWSKGECELVQFKSLKSLICAVDEGKIEKAIVPIENSIEGSVNATVDTLALEADVYITGEHILNICENIMSKHGTKCENIKKILSHPQPIGQCSKILEEKYAHAEIVHTASTAEAAKLVAESDGSVACVGPVSLSRLYNLELLEENCADDKNNSTRFVIIEKQASTEVTKHDKTSIAFTLDNKPGALYHALELLYKSNINMLKIESRPVKEALGTYIFMIDLEGNIDDANIYFALDKIKSHTDFYKFLGSYKY